MIATRDAMMNELPGFDRGPNKHISFYLISAKTKRRFHIYFDFPYFENPICQDSKKYSRTTSQA